MTQPESNSSSEEESSAHPPIFKVILGIGVMGDPEVAERFAALWLTDAEVRAHRIVEKLNMPLTLLPLPEETDGQEENEAVQDPQ